MFLCCMQAACAAYPRQFHIVLLYLFRKQYETSRHSIFSNKIIRPEEYLSFYYSYVFTCAFD